MYKCPKLNYAHNVYVILFFTLLFLGFDIVSCADIPNDPSSKYDLLYKSAYDSGAFSGNRIIRLCGTTGDSVLGFCFGSKRQISHGGKRGLPLRRRFGESGEDGFPIRN